MGYELYWAHLDATEREEIAGEGRDALRDAIKSGSVRPDRAATPEHNQIELDAMRATGQFEHVGPARMAAYRRELRQRGAGELADQLKPRRTIPADQLCEQLRRVSSTPGTDPGGGTGADWRRFLTFLARAAREGEGVRVEAG